MMVMFVIAQVRLGSEEEHREWDAREELNILNRTAKAVLGDNHGISDDELNLLLKDKNILEATKAYKVSFEKDDRAAWQAAYHNLLMLLGKSR